jgi:phage anti-repressor protein
MDLPIYISTKGTKVVAATELHQTLQLTDHHYATNVKRWITDIYEFSDDIRRPEKLRDFANRKVKGNPILKDYYLTVELAKLICLATKSKVKLKYAKLLSHAEADEAQANTAKLNEADVMKVLELTKAMSMISCQEAAEKSHLKIYEARNGGQTANWWKYRAEVLGYSATALRRKLMAMGKTAQGKTQRQMLLQLDACELIRTAVIDQFMAMGKTKAFACSMGDLAKRFAKELRIEVQDDREGMASLFAPRANDRLVKEIRGFEPKLAAMTA